MLRARPGLRGQGAAHQRADARPERTAARAGAGAARRACSAPPGVARLPPALHPAARPEAARRRRDEPARARLRRAGGARTKRTCAAARPAPTRCCSPSWPTRCATASSATWTQLQPQTIVSANIGCITHLQSGSETPVRHWVEVLDEALRARPDRTRHWGCGPTRAPAPRGAACLTCSLTGVPSMHASSSIHSARRRWLCACAAAPWMAQAQSMPPAVPAMRRRRRSGGRRSYVCGGIGSDESTAMRAAMKDHPLSLLFARAGRRLPGRCRRDDQGRRTAPPRSRCAPTGRSAWSTCRPAATPSRPPATA